MSSLSYRQTAKSLGLAILGLLVGAANAATINVDATNSGWYDNGGNSNGTGWNIAQYPGNYRNWLGFDLSSVTGTITGATLEVWSDPSNGSGQTITWWDVTTPYANLGTNSLATYGDLGSGTVFATGTHTAGTINSFSLNGAALASLNLATSFWAIGGTNAGPDWAFGYTGGVGTGDHLRLVLTTGAAVPDHGATVALLGFGFGLVALIRRKLVA